MALFYMPWNNPKKGWVGRNGQLLINSGRTEMSYIVFIMSVVKKFVCVNA